MSEAATLLSPTDDPSPNPTQQEREHLLDLLRLMDITIDLETTDLSPKYAIPTQIAARIKDITEKELARIDIRVQVPEHIVQSPAAAVITQSFPEEIHYGEGRKPPHIAAGQIAHTFGSLYRYLWDDIGVDKTVFMLGDIETDQVHGISVTDLKTIPDSLDPQSTVIRLHDGGHSFSYRLLETDLDLYHDKLYRDEDGSIWRKLTAKKAFFSDSDALWEENALNRERISFRPMKPEQVRLYKYTHADGTKETIRLHNKGKQLSRLMTAANQRPSYTDLDGSSWIKSFSSANSLGFNSIAFDSKVLKQFGFMSLLPDIIFDRLKQNHLFQTDVRVALKAVVAYNDKGAAGVQPGKAIHPQTGKEFISFGLSATLEANGPDQHGLDHSIRMPDHSLYERRLGHLDALYDIDATDALAHFLRKHDPEILRQLEANADLERYQTFLIGHDGFSDRPLRSFIRNNYPHTPSVHVGMCVGLEQDISEIRQALMVRTDGAMPIEQYQYKGKYLFGDHDTPADSLMSQSEVEEMLKAQKRKSDPEALFEIINIRKNHAVFDDELAYTRGKVHNPEWQERQRVAILNSFMQNGRHSVLMAALQNITPQFPGASDTSVTRIEEETHTRFQKPKALYLVTEQGARQASDVINAHAEMIWEQANNIDHVLRYAMGGPEPLEWLDELPPHRHIEVLDKFLEKIAKAKKDLQKYQTQLEKDPIILVEPDEDKPITLPSIKDKSDLDPELIRERCNNALDYLWKLRAAHRASFYDATNSYRVYDRHGHEVPAHDLITTHESILSQKLSSGEYSIRFEQLKYSSEQIVRMFITTPGRLEWIKGRLTQKLDALHQESSVVSPDTTAVKDEILFYQHNLNKWERWQEHNNAIAALHLWGPPHLEPRDHPWVSGLRALEEIKDIRDNLRYGTELRATDDALGLWEVLVSNRDQSEEILNQLERHIKTMLKKYPLTPERKKRLGYHEKDTLYGAKNRPIEAVKYQIPAENWVVVLDVPDQVLAEPIHHIEKGSNLIPVLLPYADLRQDLGRPDLSILFRAPESGKIFLASKISHLEDIKLTPWFDDLYAEADKRYTDAGGPPVRDNPNLVWMKVERAPHDTPLALHQPNTSLQTVKLRVPGFFPGTVSTKLSHKPVLLTSYIQRLDTPPPVAGPARLQEMVASSPAGSASVEQKFVETGWERDIHIDSVNVYTIDDFKKTISRSIKIHAIMAQLDIAEPQDIRRFVHNDDEARRLGFKNSQECDQELSAPILTHQQVMRMGYHSLEDARTKVRHLFSDKDRSEDAADSKIVIVNFQQAEKSATTYYHPPRRPDTTSPNETLRPLAEFQRPLTKHAALKLWNNPGKLQKLYKVAL